MGNNYYERTILHCDCNCFFASVEMIAHPEYKNVPMAVCGSKENRHGIVLAKNELAKKCGVSTGEAIWQAMQKCPSMVIASPHYDLYLDYSHEVNRIYSEYTDEIEPFGIDESWLDVTKSRSLFGSGKKIADEIRGRVRSELGITVSAGVSFCKTFAKLGSDYKKPDATTVIPYETFPSIIYPLPVGDMLYIGRHTVPKLRSVGIRTIGDLAKSDENFIISMFGKTGKALHDIVCGYDTARVEPIPPKAKSYGNGMTFYRDIVGEDDFRAAVMCLSDEASSRMRKDGSLCKTVQITIRNTTLKSFTRQKKLKIPTSSSLTVYHAAMELVKSSWNMDAPARTVTVSCNDILPEYMGEQLCFEKSDAELYEEKQSALYSNIDILRGKFGKGIITTAGKMKSSLWKA